MATGAVHFLWVLAKSEFVDALASLWLAEFETRFSG
jgi:hypothetical protein